MTDNYICKFPASIKEQRHSHTNRYNGAVKKYKTTRSKLFASHYGFLSIDKGNNVSFTITLNDIKNGRNIYINIAKQHLYDGLLTFLQYRPIRRADSRTKQFYCRSERLHKLEGHNGEMCQSSIAEVRERYDTAKKELGDVIVDSPSPVSKRTAELQFNRLIEAQWKMELLEVIRQSEKKIKEINISDIEENE